MRRNKVVLFLLLFFISAGLLFAQSVSKKAAGKSITIGMVGKSKSNPVFIAAYSGSRVAAKEIGAKYGVDVIIDWQTPQTENPQEQAQAVDQLSRFGAAGIAVACSDANILTPSIDKAVDLGAQVVCFDADAPNSKRFAYYGSDNVEFGRMLMKSLRK